MLLNFDSSEESLSQESLSFGLSHDTISPVMIGTDIVEPAVVYRNFFIYGQRIVSEKFTPSLW